MSLALSETRRQVLSRQGLNSLEQIVTFYSISVRSALFAIMNFFFFRLGNFSCFCPADFSLKIILLEENSFRKTLRVSNGFGPDQDLLSVCHRLSADVKSPDQQGKNIKCN